MAETKQYTPEELKVIGRRMLIQYKLGNRVRTEVVRTLVSEHIEEYLRLRKDVKAGLLPMTESHVDKYYTEHDFLRIGARTVELRRRYAERRRQRRLQRIEG